jgi:hypothetical protein
MEINPLFFFGNMRISSFHSVGIVGSEKQKILN